MVIGAAVSVGVLAIFALVTLRQLRIVGDRIFDFQVYVAMAAAMIYLAIEGADFEEYAISLAVIRFAILLWDVIDLVRMRSAAQVSRGR